MDVEIGFPVASAAAGSGRVKAGTLPGGKAAVTLHAGPYTKIGEAYNRLTAFVKEQGLDTDDFTFYLDAFRFGMPPHGGLGLGIERVVQVLLDVKNIRETVLVSSPEIPQPNAVRFAFRDRALPNLCNRNGLPAAPFRTDRGRFVLSTP